MHTASLLLASRQTSHQEWQNCIDTVALLDKDFCNRLCGTPETPLRKVLALLVGRWNSSDNEHSAVDAQTMMLDGFRGDGDTLKTRFDDPFFRVD